MPTWRWPSRRRGAAKFRNAGQVCISPTRFLVHNSVREEFTRAMVAHAEGLKVGDGLVQGTQMGPLANPRRVTALAHFIEDAQKQGAKLLTGGGSWATRATTLHPRCWAMCR